MIVLAMGCHPDDIELRMSGTLVLLKRAGAEIHYMNIANGCYGSAVLSREEAIRVRTKESLNSTRILGATFHPPVADDVEVFYNSELLHKVSSVVREVQPDILLTLSMNDYMEDHQFAARLAASAAFNRCLGAYVTDPPFPATQKPVAVYHALPHGLRDMMCNRVTPDFVVDVDGTFEICDQMLSQHVSQKDWLDQTQGIGSYVQQLHDAAREVARFRPGLKFAEGWRRHNYMGYCPEDFHPLEKTLADRIHFVGKQEK